MASELRVDTLKDASGNNSVGVSYVAQTPKVWASIDGTGTVALRDSFNVASLVDVGTGHQRCTFTSAMLNDDFACPIGCYAGEAFLQDNMTTGQVDIITYAIGGSQADTDPSTFSVIGDLA